MALRAFYLCLAVGALLLWSQWCCAGIIPTLEGRNGVVELDMEARPVGIELRPGVYFDAWAYCIKGQEPTVPGPTIKVREGTKIILHFTNKLDVPASVHPHGVKYTAANDGAHVAGNPTSIVEPGLSRTFEWDTSGTPGTWFYHTHAFERQGELGLHKGLWGALIVEPKEGLSPVDKEFVVFLHSFKKDGEDYDAFNDKSGEAAFFQGDSTAFPGTVFHATEGERLRFYLINSDPDEAHNFHTHGHRWIDKAGGGELIDNVGLSPFTSYTLELVAGEGVGPGNWLVHCHFHHHMMQGMFGVLKVAPATKDSPGIAAGSSSITKETLVTPVPAKSYTAPLKPSDNDNVLSAYKGSFAYPTPALKELYEEFVGLEQGDGLWADAYKPIPFYMYFNPARHYTPPDPPLYEILRRKYGEDQCVECHDEVTVGLTAQWKMSKHANPKGDPSEIKETEEIEQIIGKKLNNWRPGTRDGVYCTYCHGDDHDELFMPTVDNSCGLCHPRQAKEFARGRDYGRPSHPHSWEATVSSPWYVENYRRGEGYTMVGCDLCHKNMSTCDNCHSRHLFSAEEARRPEACAACHMGPDHPDWESYEHSKWGTIYHTFGDRWDWEKRLSEVIPGKDYLAPTCQYCHMYVGDGRWEMNVETKGIWRMGVIPPKEVEFKSGLKDFPYGVKIPPMDKKLEIYSTENDTKRRYWVQLCSKCHGSRFSGMWLDTLDQYMFTSWKEIDEAQLILEELFAKDLIRPSPEERPPFPLWDLMVERLGPEKLGSQLYGLFKKTSGHLPIVGPVLGAYAIFTQTDGNPSGIEREYVEMWFWHHLSGYKGTAHSQQDVSWWWGASQTIGSSARIHDRALELKRLGGLEQAPTAHKQ
ncbi:MAG: hypothetical protein A3C38_05910 [Planctomycetes bacterium RIFCSPHIGHO2_02_FULL_50_42]|nr:MAG: hypothetical protein A3C38_05910 [Planctomycetes bacterium RIFCSPHIGHO2_02_FULL_50_42]